MLSTYERRPRLKLTATLTAVVGVAGIILLADHLKTNKSTAPPLTQSNAPSSAAASSATSATGAANPKSPTTPASNPTPAASGYKDGSYTATSDYFVPNGREQIHVNLTLQNGIITNASIQNSENNFDSVQYQESFATTYKSYVVGKKIKGLQLDNVAGASDTTRGFNDAISKISAQAQA